jgi:hypothetical protein
MEPVSITRVALLAGEQLWGLAMALFALPLAVRG